MLLYVGTSVPAGLEAAFPEATIRRVDSPDAAGDVTSDRDVTALVIDPAAVDVADVVDAVHQREYVPTLLLDGDGFLEVDVDYDASVDRDGDAAAFEDAVDRARRVAAYRDAVGSLYDECRARATDDREVDADLGEPRQRADERFADLPPLDAETIDALLDDD